MLLVRFKAPASGTSSILDPHWISSTYPAVALSHGDLVAMAPQDQSRHMLLEVTDGIDAGKCQLKALDVCLVNS